MIGDKGLTEEVVAEVERALKAHELIKVKAATDDRAARVAWMEEICTRLEAHPVQAIGKVLVIYRENFDKPRESTRTSRPQSRTPSPRPASEPRRRRPRTSR